MNLTCAAAFIAIGLLVSSHAAFAINDSELARKIRQAIESDASLSAVANHLKISVGNGKVTLKGSVESEQQRDRVEKLATDAAGPGNITDDITIKAARTANHK